MHNFLGIHYWASKHTNTIQQPTEEARHAWQLHILLTKGRLIPSLLYKAALAACAISHIIKVYLCAML